MHTVLTMRPQIGDPTTTVDTVALYNKLDANNIPELFFRPNNNQTPIQLTYPSVGITVPTAQYSFVAGPFVVYGGKITNPPDGFAVNLSPSTNLIYVGLTSSNLNVSGTKFNTATTPTNISGNSFNIKYRTTAINSLDVYYLAIGLPV